MTNSLQDARRRQASIANALSKGLMINSAFEDAKNNEELFSDIFKFLLGYVVIEDLRFRKEELHPDKIRERIKNNLSDENVAHWIRFSVKKTSPQHYPIDVLEIKRCIGGLKLAAFLIKHNLIRDFFLRYLSPDVQKVVSSMEQGTSELLTLILLGSEEDAVIAAEVVYEFIGAIRDSGNEKNVLLGFFEGFTVETGAPKVFTIKWTSAPMLQALVKANKTSLVHLHDDFIRTYLAKRKRADSLEIGEWQRQYDQQFQMLINLQSGMFHPGATYVYGELQKK